MIRIEYGRAKQLDSIAVELYNKLNPLNRQRKPNAFSLKSKLLKLIQVENNRGNKFFFEELAKNDFYLLEKICISKPKELEKIINTVNILLESFQADPFFVEIRGKLKETTFGSKISKLFNYENFRKSRDCEWLIEELYIPVCPYCNRVETFTVADPSSQHKRKILLDFDHFFSKVRYPYLALSFYNLIPCCHICNSSYKGDKIFNVSTHIHPYQDNFNNILRFGTDVPLLSSDTQKFNIVFYRHDELSADNIRAERNVYNFGLKERYQESKKEVVSLYYKKLSYPESRINEMFNITIGGEMLFKNKSEILDKIFECPISDKEIRKEVLGKLRRDFAIEFGLVDHC